jgi:hypothetical protein
VACSAGETSASAAGPLSSHIQPPIQPVEKLQYCACLIRLSHGPPTHCVQTQSPTRQSHPPHPRPGSRITDHGSRGRWPPSISAWRVKDQPAAEEHRTLSLPMFPKTYAISARKHALDLVGSTLRHSSASMGILCLFQCAAACSSRETWGSCVVHSLYRDPHQRRRKGLFLSLFCSLFESALATNDSKYWEETWKLVKAQTPHHPQSTTASDLNRVRVARVRQIAPRQLQPTSDKAQKIGVHGVHLAQERWWSDTLPPFIGPRKGLPWRTLLLEWLPCRFKMIQKGVKTTVPRLCDPFSFIDVACPAGATSCKPFPFLHLLP